MENSTTRKLSVTNRYRDNTVNAGRTGILDALKGKSPVVLQKEAAAASAMFKNTKNTQLRHCFIGENSSRLPKPINITSLLPCVLASTKQLPVTSSTAFSICRSHGSTSYLSLEDIEYSEDYTRVVFRSPKPQVVHRYKDCVLEFHDG